MKKSLKDYFYVLFGTGFTRFASFINSIIIARWLGPEEFGRFTVFYIVMILTWQIPQAFDHTFIRYAKISSSIIEKNDYLKTAIFIKIVYSILLLCIAYPLAQILSNIVFEKPDTLKLIMGGMVCGIFLSFLMSVATVFQEREQFGKYALIPSLFSGSILLVLLTSKVTGFLYKINYTKGLVEIYVAIAVFLGTASIISLLKITGSPFPVNMSILKKSFSFGKWILGVTVAYYIFQRLDVVVLARYSIYQDVGIYFVAVQPIMVISLLMGSISGVFLPKAMNAIKSKSALVSHVKESLFAVSIPISGIIVLLAVAPYFIRVFYGEQYLEAGNILRVLLVGWLFASLYLPFSFLFYAMNDSRTRFVLELVKILTVLILLLYLVPLMGMFGAALSISIALILNALISLTVLWFKINSQLGLRKVPNVINTNS